MVFARTGASNSTIIQLIPTQIFYASKILHEGYGVDDPFVEVDDHHENS